MDALSISLVDSAPRPIAYVRRQATLGNISVVTSTTPVWSKVTELGLQTTDRPVSIFWDDGSGGLFAEPGLPTDIGAELAEPFAGDATLLAGTTPAGRAATCRFVGRHDEIEPVHHAIREWCVREGHRLAGPVWELYYWNQDPARVVTDVYYLLA